MHPENDRNLRRQKSSHKGAGPNPVQHGLNTTGLRRIDIDLRKLAAELGAMRRKHSAALCPQYPGWFCQTLDYAAASREELDSALAHLDSILLKHGWGRVSGPLLGSLTDVLLLNPQVRIRDGRFDLLEQLKAPFVVSLAKSLVGRVQSGKLTYENYGELLRTLGTGELFADNREASVAASRELIRDSAGLLGNKEDNFWAPVATTPGVMDDPQRLEFREPLSEPISGLISHLATKFPDAKFLEIGSGWGNLFALLPKHARSRFEFLEWNPNFSRLFTQRCPEAAGAIRSGNAYNLTDYYPENSLAGIVMLTAASSFYDLDHVLDQCFRVLRPGGFIISMHDGVIPNDQQVREQLQIRGMHGAVEGNYWARTPEGAVFLEGVVGKRLLAPDTGLEERSLAAAVLSANTAVQNMFEYFYAWLELELTFRGFRLRSPVGAKDFVACTARRREHSGFYQTYGLPEGIISMGGGLELDGCPYLKALYADLAPHGQVIEHAIAWMAIAEKVGA